jgi:hypothetical protein
MHVSRLVLAQIRCFESVDIELSDGVNLLVGENNSGKSTLIGALFQLQSDLMAEMVRLRSHLAVIQITLRNAKRRDFSEPALAQLVAERFATHPLEVHFEVQGAGRKAFVPYGKKELAFSRFPAIQPRNFVVPYLSSRRAANMSQAVSENHALSVTGLHDTLYARIDRVFQSPALRDTYERACKDVLGFVPVPYHTGDGKAAGIEIDPIERVYIPLPQMGAGVTNAVGLIVELAVARGKLFLIEELENDMHPTALRALLKLIEISASNGNQFVISTHSNIVVRRLGSLPSANVVEVVRGVADAIPTSTASQVPADAPTRIQLLRKLGYELADSELYEAWLLLEESSAERIVRDFLIPWFVPELQGRVRTIAAQGANDVVPRFSELHRVMLFLHLQPVYQHRAWVVVDGDEAGKNVVKELREQFANWPASHFDHLSERAFELFYPVQFRARAETVLAIADKKKRQAEKESLLVEVLGWLRTDASAKSELSTSCAEVIERLRSIAAALGAVSNACLWRLWLGSVRAAR